ncbi:hypothetical protein [Streptomyces sp. NPDC047123]|uniref:hypothetical protein n=1 Tax=Streptomyces sp. NPDC047123 TaxID=3155622 RepID=UPI0033F8BCD6
MDQENSGPAGEASLADEDYLVDFESDDGWLHLTLQEGTRAEAQAIAADLAAQFNPLKLGGSRAALQEELANRALTAFESGPVLAMAAYAEGGILLADLAVFAYGEDDVRRPSPQEYLPQLLKWPYAQIKGEPQVTEKHLPLGPALRVQAVLVEKRRFGWGKKLSESLQYGVWPDGREEILVVEARWLNFERTDELTDLVDRLMPTMRIVPAPAQPGTDAADRSPHES